ncbi:hypothetical protein K432DRAFT_428489 [Lepidopterella palustris CBS 459.81]|uniref:Stress-response A/B barrel domain-containing protein n=1 Tax=Lepidopterella palustris CBS 459.81 TaxID=1314670 RepID=A0A8E2E3U4_9PEZI|nr:hypothetical protein K432DRAFT_428489 [Lepidopterella palustris CBS 459.81]
MAPIIRFVAFKYKPSVTETQKRKVADELVALYELHAALLDYGPRGGKPINSVKLSKGFDVAFTAQFKSREAIEEFDHADQHTDVGNHIKPLIEDAFVYDYEEAERFGF